MKTLVYQREAVILKALGHPKRLEILHLLQQNELTASQIEDMTGFPQANVSQHLHLLKTAQIILATRSGKQIRYRITHPNFIKASGLIQAVTNPKQRKIARGVQARDLVCGMAIAPASALCSTIYKGATYYFCASGCQKKFLRTPNAYVK